METPSNMPNFIICHREWNHLAHNGRVNIIIHPLWPINFNNFELSLHFTEFIERKKFRRFTDDLRTICEKNQVSLILSKEFQTHFRFSFSSAHDIITFV